MKKYIYYILNFFFEDFTSFFLKKFNYKKKLVIFDVGCFRGTFLESIKKILLNKNSVIYMFDPNPNVPKYLSIKNNINCNLFFHNVAASNKNGKSNFYLNKSFESSGSSLNKDIFPSDKKWNYSRNLFLKLFLQKTDGYTKLKVKTIKLDTFIKKKFLKKIDIIKIDVEGGEEKVLEGLKNTLKKDIIKYIQVEISSRKNDYLKKEMKIKKILNKNRYKLIKTINLPSVSLFSDTKSTDSLYCRY